MASRECQRNHVLSDFGIVTFSQPSCQGMPDSPGPEAASFLAVISVDTTSSSPQLIMPDFKLPDCRPNTGRLIKPLYGLRNLVFYFSMLWILARVRKIKLYM